MQTQSSADRIMPHSALPIREKNKQNLSSKLTLYKAYTNHLTNLQEGRNQKQERVQPWSLEKGDLKHNKLKNNNEKVEKYYTNEVEKYYTNEVVKYCTNEGTN